MRSDQMPTKANLKDHDDDEKCPSIESALIDSLKQQNEALLAQVVELRSVMIKESAFILRERFCEGIDDGCEERLRKCACRIIDSSRKYQSSNDTKAAKGGAE